MKGETIVEAVDRAQVARVAELFREYGLLIAGHVCASDLEAEMAGLPGRYGRRPGGLLLAEVNGVPAGCVALRPALLGEVEVKRLYVRPGFRGTGLGRRLMEAALSHARTSRCRRVVLDTLPSFTAARALYESLGFRLTRQRGPDEPLDYALDL